MADETGFRSWRRDDITVLDVRDRSETVVFDLEDVFGRIEGLQKAG